MVIINIKYMRNTVLAWVCTQEISAILLLPEFWSEKGAWWWLQVGGGARTEDPRHHGVERPAPSRASPLLGPRGRQWDYLRKLLPVVPRVPTLHHHRHSTHLTDYHYVQFWGLYQRTRLVMVVLIMEVRCTMTILHVHFYDRSLRKQVSLPIV